MAAVLTLSSKRTPDVRLLTYMATQRQRKRRLHPTPPPSPPLWHENKRVQVENQTVTSGVRNSSVSTNTESTPSTPSAVSSGSASPVSEESKDRKQSGEDGKTLSEYVLRCLANYGLCVLDNFMGTDKAEHILEDVEELDKAGVLVTGRTVQKQDDVQNVRKVRQDRIAFLEKSKSQAIDHLVSKVDNLLTSVQAKSKACSEKKGFFDISGRTRAMVSCYPGNGTHYVRHVDNHHKDGRCITVVYYLNRDWDEKQHGGMLKLYPQLVPRVATIEPKIDRLLLFWSDDRNPHEVLPAFRKRYAITVWYFDREERQSAIAKHRAASKSGGAAGES